MYTRLHFTSTTWNPVRTTVTSMHYGFSKVSSHGQMWGWSVHVPKDTEVQEQLWTTTVSEIKVEEEYGSRCKETNGYSIK